MLESCCLGFWGQHTARSLSWWGELSQWLLAVFFAGQSSSSSHWLCSYYEGYSIQSITLPIRVLKRLGVDTVIGTMAYNTIMNLEYMAKKSPVTNAAGGLNADYAVGDIVVLNDVRFMNICATYCS